MSSVPQRILEWLHTVLQSNYYDAAYTYHDVHQLLLTYPNFAIKTDVYTFESGQSDLLLLISGNIPVQFRGAQYAFPAALWIPKNYPASGPLAFVLPGKGMIVRPGQFVSLEGQVYHPILAEWHRGSTLVNLCRVLQDVFSREPPLVSQSPQRHVGISGTSFTPDTQVERVSHNAGPRLPPKPGIMRLPEVSKYDSPAPLPPGGLDFEPIPLLNSGTHGILDRLSNIQISNQVQSQSLQNTQNSPYNHQNTTAQQRMADSKHEVIISPPFSRHPISSFAADSLSNPLPINPLTQNHVISNQRFQSTSKPASSRPPNQPKEAQFDLLTSSFETNERDNKISSLVSPPPPAPRNPTKSALLTSVAEMVAQHTQKTESESNALLDPLKAQQTAISTAMKNIQKETEELQNLDKLLASNETILRRATQEAEQVLEQAKTTRVPNVDDVLLPPNVAARQLYSAVAELHAIEDSRSLLAKALDKGRISSFMWAKQSRGLAREEFLEKALIKKICAGMGLSEQVSW